MSEIQEIINYVILHSDSFVKWPKKAHLLLPGVKRIKYHKIPEHVKMRIQEEGYSLDSRSNGPAIMSYLLAGGERPLKDNGHGWSIHHIYDGRHPFTRSSKTLHAVKDGEHFTQSAGLVALHPIADSLAHECYRFAWYLRNQAYGRFGYDPDSVFS